MPLRIGAVAVGYLIYRIVGQPIVGAFLVWVGFVMLTWAIIEQATTYRKDRLGMMIVGQALLGIGLLVAGALVVMR